MNHPVPNWLRKLAWSGVGIWVVTIFILSSLTPIQLQRIEPFRLWDKCAHFIAFGAGAVNLALALRWSRSWTWKKIALVTFAAIAFYGAFDEIHQLFTPHRSGADLFDWIADSLGAAAGICLTIYCHDRFRRENS
jgi:VanZ family protein